MDQGRQGSFSLKSNQISAHIRIPQCLGSLPHDDALSPTVNPPDIGPVNVSGSYYDDFVYIHMVS
jgi:tyrosinase